MNVTQQALKTPLHEWHASNNGRMVEFAGWSMPVQYTSIVEEHHATRKAIGMFDVSHMGRFTFKGPDAGPFLDSLTTRKVNNVGVGKIRYSLVCNDEGGILDDVLVYQLADAEGKTYYAMVVNASNREKIADWINQHVGSHDIGFEDSTLDTAMFAVQGPKANEIVASLGETDPANLKYYTGVGTEMCGGKVGLSRTGYTGEDGCEIICGGDDAVKIWQAIFDAGQSVGLKAAGLGARDTLRLEAAMPLYGHELGEDMNPVMAGLNFAINLKDRQFIGRNAIVNFKNDSTQPVRVGLKLDGPRAAREGCAVLSETGSDSIGTVTSGTTSPTLGFPISMAYIKNDFATAGTRVSINNRGKSIIAEVVDLPFYTRPT